MSRTLSYTEISNALTCFAQWDFAYGGHLAGGFTLKPRETAPRLSNGRAWGAGVATWHAGGSLLEANNAIWESLADDFTKMRDKGVNPDPEQFIEAQEYLFAVLSHYTMTARRLPGLERIEDELNVPIPSRAGKRGSSRYRFHCYLDGHSIIGGHPTIVEFKLRDSLTDPEIIEKQPQYRWYALAYAIQEKVRGPVGILIDERLNAAPKAVNINKNGKPSHDKRQMVTGGEYLKTCAKYGVEHSPEALATFNARQWGQRVDLLFTPAELREAAHELVSAAQLIRDLDSGRQYPIRNGKPANCRNCKFRSVCLDPHNSFTVNNLFERTEPKRLRPPLTTTTQGTR